MLLCCRFKEILRGWREVRACVQAAILITVPPLSDFSKQVTYKDVLGSFENIVTGSLLADLLQQIWSGARNDFFQVPQKILMCNSMLDVGTIELWPPKMRVSVKLEITVLCQIPLHKEKLYKQKYLSGIIICYPQKIVCDL